MEIIKTKKPIPRPVIDRAVQILKRGGIIVYPTDSSYGIGCNPASQKAVDKIFKMKNRPRSEPMLIIAASRAMATKYARLKKEAKKAAIAHWPGPLTLVLPKEPGSRLARGLARKGSIAVRVPDDEFLKKLLRRYGRPIVSTSANFSRQKPIYDGAYLEYYFSQGRIKPDLIIDAGKLREKKPSTVAAFIAGEKIIIRKGPVKL